MSPVQTEPWNCSSSCRRRDDGLAEILYYNGFKPHTTRIRNKEIFAGCVVGIVSGLQPEITTPLPLCTDRILFILCFVLREWELVRYTR